jgi:hypothetical protein
MLSFQWVTRQVFGFRGGMADDMGIAKSHPPSAQANRSFDLFASGRGQVSRFGVKMVGL